MKFETVKKILDHRAVPFPGSKVGSWVAQLEIFDTRVLPGESVKLDYALARAPGATALLGRVSIDPDFHYRGVFDLLMESLEDASARAQIEEARRRISDSTYVLTEIRRPLLD